MMVNVYEGILPKYNYPNTNKFAVATEFLFQNG